MLITTLVVALLLPRRPSNPSRARPLRALPCVLVDAPAGFVDADENLEPGEMPKPTPAPAGAAPDAREASREARRVYSAKENEMIFYVQPSMEQVLSDIARKGGAQGTAAHPYACTRRRSAGAAEDGDEKQNDAPRRPLPGAAGVPAAAPSGAYVAPPSQPH